jgi:hypothetical protein
MLEKLLRLGSFGTIMGHLARCQVTFLISSRGLNLPLMVQCVAPAFLGCSAIIAHALTFHFQ